MRWMLTTHVRRYLSYYGPSDLVWQGRFKALPIQDVEPNNLQAALAATQRSGHLGWADEVRVRAVLYPL